MLQALEARNTYDLKFRSFTALVKGVSSLKGVKGLTVTPYDRSVVVTVLYLNFEVEQGLVARVLGQYGTVSDMRWCTYGENELQGILNGKRQFRMVLKKDIPSFLFIGGSKAHIRYFGQIRTCFKCGEEGHEAKSCPNRRCGKCLQLGHGKAKCLNRVRCNLCGEEGHVLGACPTSYSARDSAGVGTAPEPSQPGPGDMVEEPRSPSPDQVADQVEQDFLASKHCQCFLRAKNGHGQTGERIPYIWPTTKKPNIFFFQKTKQHKPPKSPKTPDRIPRPARTLQLRHGFMESLLPPTETTTNDPTTQSQYNTRPKATNTPEGNNTPQGNHSAGGHAGGREIERARQGIGNVHSLREPKLNWANTGAPCPRAPPEAAVAKGNLTIPTLKQAPQPDAVQSPTQQLYNCFFLRTQKRARGNKVEPKPEHCQSVSMTPEAGPSPSSPPPSGEAELLILEDLRLSSESDLDMTDAGEPASEPPPKDPPSEDGWFDLGRGEPKSELKGSALGEVCDHGVHSEAPVPSPRINRPKPQSSVGFGLEGVDFV
ncbi:Zinc finger CCHC domain-containing protein 3 [Holothuria leucospilota]|uniref:Zinc finger CCHC domain-containing protein 3 n=1 Tax=Holothuria leucospilota TaxID=206669 RepID=A0A9Q1CD89_HOLLE|nr:Zinc finger CCHC domain-containing protein 3 [Holothuria leucospilota]